MLSKKTYFIFHLSIQNFKCIYIGLNEPAQVVEDFNLSDLCYVALQGGNNLCKAAVSGFVLFVNFECSSPNQSTAQPGQLQMMLLEQLQDLAGSRVCVFSILRQCLSLFQNLNLKKKKKKQTVRKQHLAQKQDAHLFSDRVERPLGDLESIYSQKACARCSRTTVLQREERLVASPHDRVWQSKSVIIMFKKLL